MGEKTTSDEREGEPVKACIFIVTVPMKEKNEEEAEEISSEIKDKVSARVSNIRWMWELDR